MTAALRILLVDDDPNDRRLVRQTLEKAFSSMELTEVAEEVGLGRVLEQDPPDVVLTDYALGWTSGLVVLLKVKQRWPGVPVLMVTGTGSEEIAVECMKEGLEDYILKSSRHIVRLPSAVEAALERVQEHRTLREAEAELRRRHDEMHRLASRLAEVEEAERQRLARELHDQVGQNLTALGISLSIVRAQLPRGTEPAIDARIEDLLALVEETTSRIRSVMGDLRPPVLDDYGLVAALGWYARQVSLRTGVPVEVAGDECAPRLLAPVESALFRIAQEALNNIAKHANATRVTIVFECHGAMARLVIADDGHGFAPSEAGVTEERPRWGLRIMRERADGVGGTCRVESRPGQGARVIVEVPR
ncbi:MAG: response regulator [candidate division NC10 bacterium]